MGEIAEAMLTGELCCQCGQALDEKVVELDMGIPVICDDCYSGLSKKEKKDYECRYEGFF